MNLTLLKTIRLLHMIDKQSYNEKRQIEIVKTSPLFDKNYYLNRYPDVNPKKISPAKHYVKFGWKEGRDPSSTFTTNEYLLVYPELKQKNICPIFHKEKMSSANSNKIKIKFPSNAHTVSYRSKAPLFNQHNRVAIFASFSADGTIHDYVIYYLKELKKVTDAIIFIADNPLIKSELNKIKDIVTYAHCERHEEYDFGSYKRGFHYAKTHGFLDKYQELIICNDSCYGPVYPFSDIFATMDKKQCDFWGMMPNTDVRYHLQSYFFVFRHTVLKDNTLKNFLKNVKKEASFWDVVYNYELKLTNVLQQKGFTASAYMPDYFADLEARCVRASCRNKTVFPLTLIEKYKFPFIKLKCFNNSLGYTLEETPESVLAFLKKQNPELRKVILDDLAQKKLTKRLYKQNVFLKIKYADLVSFSAFGTLLITPYAQKEDLYQHLETYYQTTGFAQERLAAEHRAHLKHPNKAITLHDIYEEILPKYKIFKARELAFMFTQTTAHPHHKKIYHHALKHHKKIIITTTTTLPKNYLHRLLKKMGYTGYTDIYTTYADKTMKKQTKLFRHIIQTSSLSPQQILHIGDNPQQDSFPPQKLKITTHALDNHISDFFRRLGNKKYNIARNETPNLTISILCSLLAKRQLHPHTESSYWQEIGYTLAGPLTLGYTQFILKETQKNKIDTLLFSSPLLQKLYQQLAPNSVQNYHIANNLPTIKATNIATIEIIPDSTTLQTSCALKYKKKYSLGFYLSLTKLDERLKHLSYKQGIITPKTEYRLIELINLLTNTNTPIYPKIEKGIIEFIDDCQQTYGKTLPQISMEDNLHWLKSYLQNLTFIDVTALKSLKTPSPNTSSFYEYLYPKSA